MKKFIIILALALGIALTFPFGDYYLKLFKIEDAIMESGFTKTGEGIYRAEHSDYGRILVALRKRVQTSGFIDSSDVLVRYGLPIPNRKYIIIRFRSSDPMISQPLVPVDPDSEKIEKEPWIVAKVEN